MKINTLQLEQIHLGERKMTNEIDINQKEAIQKALSELDVSDKEILDKYSTDSMMAAVVQKLAALEKSTSFNNNNEENTVEFKPQKEFRPAAKTSGSNKSGSQDKNKFVRFFANPQHIVIVAAAACFALAVPVITLSNQRFSNADIDKSTISNNSESNVSVESYEDTSRIKGNGSRLYIYRQDGLEAVKLDSNAKVSEGDTLQISYIAAGAKYGAIISIDGNGTITQHFPYDNNQCEELETSGEIALNYSYQLDDAPSFERFMLITSSQPFSTTSLITKLVTANEQGTSKTISTAKLQEKGMTISDLLLTK